MRGALQPLVHELCFKSSHFTGLKGHSPREVHDLDHRRYASCPDAELHGLGDPSTALLVARAARIPGADVDELVDTWQRAESTLNARMRLVLVFLGTEMSQARGDLTAGADVQLPSLRVTAGRNPICGKRNDKLFGQPDIVLVGDSVAVSSA